jgi:hypothetical protein
MGVSLGLHTAHLYRREDFEVEVSQSRQFFLVEQLEPQQALGFQHELLSSSLTARQSQ